MLWYPRRAFSQYSFQQDQSSRTAATPEGLRTNAPEAGIYLRDSRSRPRGRFLNCNNSFRVFIPQADNSSGTLCVGNISTSWRGHAAGNNFRLPAYRTTTQAASSAHCDYLLNFDHRVFHNRVNCDLPHQPNCAATRYAARHAVDWKFRNPF